MRFVAQLARPHYAAGAPRAKLALLLSASGLESFRFSAPAIITFRIVTVVVFVGLLAAETAIANHLSRKERFL